MKPKKQSYPPIHIGTSFMLVIFIVLCMVVFAVLSLANAHKDYEYSLKNADRTSKYYEANNLAEEKLAEIDALLASQSLDMSNSTLEFSVPVNDSELLQVVLQIHPQNTPRYTITTWKTISTKEWTGDSSLPVLGSE